jgi:DNA repair exonuclease SbcCD nuclease subunit
MKVADVHFYMQVVSSPNLMQSGVDNTQDLNMNVSLPVFTIHGNHDDPSGPEDLSAVDILSTVHYVNYFGKQVYKRDEKGDLGRIKLSPLLLRKVCILPFHTAPSCRQEFENSEATSL